MALNLTGLHAFRAGLEETIDAGTKEIAETVKAKRDELTPIDTGELLDSGEVIQVGSGAWLVREGAGIGDARAIYTEYGTVHQSAQPHMGPAVEQTDAVAIMQRHISDLISRSSI